jgi:hypothetical protein
MTKHTLRFSAAIVAAFMLFACQKQISGSAETTATTSSSSGNVVTAPPCGMLTTYTQGGWGASPAGNNPGTYLHANFAAAFNGALTVGCFPGNYYVKLTSADAITNLLPTGGKGAALTANYVNPSTLKNVLVGQLVALKLSVGFDAWDAGFGQSDVALGNMVIGSGAFQGATVSQFVTIADQVLGGCNSNYTPAQVLETAAAINENFDNGTTNNGYLTCPDGNNNSNGGGGSTPAL